MLIIEEVVERRKANMANVAKGYIVPGHQFYHDGVLLRARSIILMSVLMQHGFCHKQNPIIMMHGCSSIELKVYDKSVATLDTLMTDT